MARIEFKREISVDTLIATIALLVMLSGMWISINARLTAVEVKADSMWQRFIAERR